VTRLSVELGRPLDDARLEDLLAEAALGMDAAPHVARVQPAITAAWAQRELPATARGGAGLARTARHGLGWWLRGPHRRRALGVVRPVLAGGFALALATGSAAASTTPGAPLYGTRLGIERALLPAPGTASRVAAEVEYADRRLAEARQASDHGDEAAVSAAVTAFTDGLHDLASDRLGPGLHLHMAQDADVLTRLRGRADDPVTIAAITAAERELAALEDRDPSRTAPVRHSKDLGPGSPRRP
jgi:hypothetical protein